MKLSIIIINYKSEPILKKCLKSINYNHSYEIIIVDNENNPKLMQKISQYPKVSILPFKGNLGFSGGNNRGILQAKGEYIMTLNADVFLGKNYIKNCLEFLDKHQEYASIQGKLLFNQNKKIIDATSNYLTKIGFAFAENHLKKDYHPKSQEVFGVCAAAAIYRKKALEDVKFHREYFDNDFFAYLEDVDLDWRLKLKGYKSYFIDSAIAYHIRESTTNIRYRQKQALRNVAFLVFKNDNFIGILWKLPFYFCLDIIFGYFRHILDFLLLFPKMIQKRKIIQKNKKKIDFKKWIKPFPWHHLKKSGNFNLKVL